MTCPGVISFTPELPAGFCRPCLLPAWRFYPRTPEPQKHPVLQTGKQRPVEGSHWARGSPRGRAGRRASAPRAQRPSAPQYEPIVTEGNEALVHHMEVFQCAAEIESVPPFSGPCDSKMKPARLSHCRHVLAAWALGAKVRARATAAPRPTSTPSAPLPERPHPRRLRRVCTGPSPPCADAPVPGSAWVCTGSPQRARVRTPPFPALPASQRPWGPLRLFPASVTFL